MKKLTLAAIAVCVALGGTAARAQDAGALLANVFAVGDFPPGSYRRLVTLVSEQATQPVVNAGTVYGEGTMSAPLAGTPAYTYFNPYIDWISAPTPGVQVYATNRFGSPISSLNDQTAWQGTGSFTLFQHSGSNAAWILAPDSASAQALLAASQGK